MLYPWMLDSERDPEAIDPNPYLNLIDLSLGHAPPLPKISSKSVRSFLRYLTYTGTDTQTRIQTTTKTLSPRRR